MNLFFDTYIIPTIITFTPDVTSIIADSDLSTLAAQSSVTDNYLKIQILPTADGKNIKSLSFIYNNIIKLHEVIDNSDFFLNISLNMEGNSLLEKCLKYIAHIPHDDLLVINSEYVEYMDSTLICLVASIASYIT